MDWISTMFSWEMAALTAMGLLCVAALILIRRISTGGLGTFDQSVCKMQRRISDTDAEIRGHTLAMSTGEQLYVLQAALRELLELEGSPTGYAVHRTEKSLCLLTPTGTVDILYTVRQSVLRSARRVMRGGAHWEVRQGDEVHSFPDLAPLMRYLRGVVSPQKLQPTECPSIPSLSHAEEHPTARVSPSQKGHMWGSDE